MVLLNKKKKSLEITEIMRTHPLSPRNIRAQLHGSLSYRVWTKVVNQTLKQFFLCDEMMIFIGALHPLKCCVINFCTIDETKLWKLSIYYFWTFQRPNNRLIRT